LLVKKEEDFILFQSKYGAILHLKYPQHIFRDAAYYSAPALCFSTFNNQEFFKIIKFVFYSLLLFNEK